MLYTILQTLALVLTLESAVFLVRGNFTLSAQQIAELSRAYFDFNPHLVQALSGQTVDTRIGAVLLIAAFLVQVITLWKGPKIDDLGPANRSGLAIGILLGALVFGGCWWASTEYSASVAGAVEGILKANIKSESKAKK